MCMLHAIQPALGAGNKKMTFQELEYYLKPTRIAKTVKDAGIEGLMEPYPQYAEKLAQLENHCELTADLRGLFDDFEGTIYFDAIHVIPEGNNIIAEKMYKLSLPIVIERSKHVVSNNDSQEPTIIENDSQMILRNFEVYYEDFYITLKKLISPYQTPRVISLIFE